MVGSQSPASVCATTCAKSCQFGCDQTPLPIQVPVPLIIPNRLFRLHWTSTTATSIASARPSVASRVILSVSPKAIRPRIALLPVGISAARPAPPVVHLKSKSSSRLSRVKISVPSLACPAVPLPSKSAYRHAPLRVNRCVTRTPTTLLRQHDRYRLELT